MTASYLPVPDGRGAATRRTTSPSCPVGRAGSRCTRRSARWAATGSSTWWSATAPRHAASPTALAADRGTEILNEVVLNQVLVRFDDSDERTADVIRRVQADGTAWFGGGTWQGRGVMRISVINWWTRDHDVDLAVDALRRALAESRAAG